MALMKDSVRKDIVLRFAEAIQHSIRDIAAVEFDIDIATVQNERLKEKKGTTVLVDFIGQIQGLFVVTFPDETACRLVEKSGGDATDSEAFADFLRELVNPAVGECMGDFEREFGVLTYLSPVVVFGTVSFPPIDGVHFALRGEVGQISCTVAANFMRLDIADHLHKTRNALAKKTEEARTDPLTGLFNRGYFEERLEFHINQSRRDNSPLSLVMIDVDNFKTFNTRYGHQTGDLVLRIVATALEKTIGENGIVARYGGDEFLVILPNKNLSEAKTLASNIQIEVHRQQSASTNNNEMDILPVTISLGVTELDNSQNGWRLLRQADTCLDLAKKAGKNVVITGTELDSEVKTPPDSQ